MNEKITNALPLAVRVARTIFGPGNEFCANPDADLFGSRPALLNRP